MGGGSFANRSVYRHVLPARYVLVLLYCLDLEVWFAYCWLANLTNIALNSWLHNTMSPIIDSRKSVATGQQGLLTDRCKTWVANGQMQAKAIKRTMTKIKANAEMLNWNLKQHKGNQGKTTDQRTPADCNPGRTPQRIIAQPSPNICAHISLLWNRAL